MIRFYKLFDLMNRRGLMRTELLKVISSRTLAKLNKGEPVRTDTIDKICEYLNVQPGDIMEYKPPDSYDEIEKGIDKMCESYEEFYDLIPKEEVKLLIKRHMKKTKDGEAYLNHDKFIAELKNMYHWRDLEREMERKPK